jgi:hypothetical protein
MLSVFKFNYFGHLVLLWIKLEYGLFEACYLGLSLNILLLI